MFSREGRAPAIWALVVAVAIAAGGVGCGGDDDDGADSRSGDAAASEAATPAALPAEAAEPRTAEEEAIHAAYGKFTAAMSAHDAKAACAMFTPQWQRKVGNGVSCERSIGGLLEGSQPGKPAYITTLEVEGDRAVAGVKTRTSKTYDVEFTKRDGEWKISGDEE